MKLNILYLVLISLLTNVSRAQNFPVEILSPDESIDGAQIKEKIIPYSKFKVDGQEEGDVLFYDSGANNGQGLGKPIPSMD